MEARYGDLTSSYCADCPGSRGGVCQAPAESPCPRPRLLPAASRAVEAFTACETQWEVVPYVGLTGLRYEDCRVAIAARWPRLSERARERLLLQVQVIEKAMLAAAAERRASSVE